jgi:uncharacterized protein (TIGR02118 family)
VVKVIATAQRHPTNRTLEEFHAYWAQSHGPLFANTRHLRRYVQHLTLPEAYGVDPAPTYDGCSMFWYDAHEPLAAPTDDPDVLSLLHALNGFPVEPADPETLRAAAADPEALALFQAVLEDDAQLFDRSAAWPRHGRRASVFAEERVVVDGPASPGMVKAIFVATKLPGLTLGEFFDRWQHHHGALAARVPGLRRYVQNHAIPEAYADRAQTHDGWSEVWFDDLASLHGAAQSPEWQALRDDGATLFAQPLGVGVAREGIQKELEWTYDDWGVGAMSEEEVREQLRADGYATLAADPEAPGKIKAAAAAEALAVWTSEHLVTIDGSRIDARPER